MVHCIASARKCSVATYLFMGSRMSRVGFCCRFVSFCMTEIPVPLLIRFPSSRKLEQMGAGRTVACTGLGGFRVSRQCEVFITKNDRMSLCFGALGAGGHDFLGTQYRFLCQMCIEWQGSPRELEWICTRSNWGENWGMACLCCAPQDIAHEQVQIPGECHARSAKFWIQAPFGYQPSPTR